MISTKELFNKFKAFVERGEFVLEDKDYVLKYASGSDYLEIGYYSLSKTDLLVGGVKRGRSIKKPQRPFNGYEYYFLEDRLVAAKELSADHTVSITFLEYEGDYCFGYMLYGFDDPEPSICFAYEMEGTRIKAFKRMDSYPLIESWPDIDVWNEQYSYSGDELISIDHSQSLFDHKNGSERFLSDTRCDYFDGKKWAPSGNAVKETDHVIDNQKKLCKKLEKKIKQDMSLDQAIETFFNVVSEARPNKEEMLLYEVGCYPFDKDSPACYFCLVRQTPSPDGEFYQMHLELQYDVCDEVSSLSECEWHEPGDEDLFEHVKKSEAYKVLKDKKIRKISVWVDET